MGQVLPTNPQEKALDLRTYCICNMPWEHGKFYIGCDYCDGWYHGKCVGIQKRSEASIIKYMCPLCAKRKIDPTSKLHENETEYYKEKYKESNQQLESLKHTLDTQIEEAFTEANTWKTKYETEKKSEVSGKNAQKVEKQKIVQENDELRQCIDQLNAAHKTELDNKQRTLESLSSQHKQTKLDNARHQRKITAQEEQDDIEWTGDEMK